MTNFWMTVSHNGRKAIFKSSEGQTTLTLREGENAHTWTLNGCVTTPEVAGSDVRFNLTSDLSDYLKLEIDRAVLTDFRTGEKVPTEEVKAFEAQQQEEKLNSLKQLETELRAVKDSLYGMAGYNLLEGSKLHKLKHSITDCINEAWNAMNS